MATPSLIPHNGINRPLFQQAETLIRGHYGKLLDIGPGLRPQNMIACNEHVCIEPHFEYADALEAAGYKVIRDTAAKGIENAGKADIIMALDVIEHMEKADGWDFVHAAVAAAPVVVIFTPLGVMEQHGGDATDPWGAQGQRWQKHLSGWQPSDFPGWEYVIDKRFFPRHGAFFAIRK